MTIGPDTEMHAVAIAVIGMAGRFPGANSVSEFWQLLVHGREGIRFFREAELVSGGVPVDLVRHPNYVPAKGYLNGAFDFDAELFGYHPRDAQIIDPQQRLLLECCWEAMEDAGWAPDRFPGLIGMFAGVSMNSWIYQIMADEGTRQHVSPYQLMISNDKDYAATRVSYQLNLRGPSMAIQTACSTSLVAVERACQSLASYECDMALAGAASLSFPRRIGYLYEEGMILSPDGHCRVFDAAARGTVPGEGVGVVVLKRLSDALVDGDTISAVIRGWATNNDGSNKAGFTAPSISGQSQVIASAMAFAQVPADTIDYIEAHGTATPLGDPIEIAALSDAFRRQSNRQQFCRIGAVKSNIGHLDTAAGIAGLIKTVLALKHAQIPPTLHYQNPNPEIDFERSPFVVNDKLVPWESDDTPRRAGVSSFGIGGTNCHLVLEEAPETPTGRGQQKPCLLLLSAKSERAVEQSLRRLSDHLDREQSARLADVAYTLQVGRRHFKYRRAVVCHSREETLRCLAAPHPGMHAGATDGSELPVSFLFPGQGAQRAGMGAGLREAFPVYREWFDRCVTGLLKLGGPDLRRWIGVRPSDEETATRELRETAVAQPALFVAGYAMARLLESCGVHAHSLIGHSIGELVAACCAGVMSLDDALGMVLQRGRCMQAAPPGSMLAVLLPDGDRLQSFLTEEVTVAAYNGPGSVVIAGPIRAIESVERRLQAADVRTQRLQTSHGFHCWLMDSAVQPFKNSLKTISFHPPSKPFISNVTGDWITEEQAQSPSYWASQIRHPVQFLAGVQSLLRDRPRAIVEVGPGRVLSGLVAEAVRERPGNLVAAAMPAPGSPRDEESTFWEFLGKLWIAGVPIDWENVQGERAPRRIPLPTYPFQRQRFAIATGVGSAHEVHRIPRIARQAPGNWFYEPSWLREDFVEPREPAAHRLRWLILVDSLGLGERLAEDLRAEGHDIITVRTGLEFQQVDRNSFVIDPSRYGSYSQLLAAVSRQNVYVDRVVHCWCLTRAMADEDRETREQRGFYSLLFLSQLFGRLAVPHAIRIDVISNHTQDVLGSEPLDPVKAMLRGPLLVAPQEYPHVRCQHLDIEYEGDRHHQEWVAKQVRYELDREDSGAETAIRGRTRWVRNFRRLRMPITDRAWPQPANGAWIIVGGLGQIGLTMAGWLASECKQPLVLVGRSAFAAEAEWERWLQEHDADDATSRRIMALRAIKASGCEVHVLSANLADKAAMQAIARRCIHEFGAIAGIVHSAGVVESRLIQYTSPRDCQQQFQAKVEGLDVLQSLVEEFSIPNCIVNSSLSSVLGGLGFCAYTASNLYLDAFTARVRRSAQTRWMTINWDGWLFPEVAEYMKNDPAAQLTLTPEEGVKCLRRMIRSPVQHVVISTGDLDERVGGWVRHRAESWPGEEHEEEGVAERHARPRNLTVSYEAPRSELERAIANVWEELLGITGIGIFDEYLELGGHSLLAGRIVGRLRERLQVPISIRSLFEFPTIAQLALHVEAIRLTLRDDEGEDRTPHVQVEI